MLDYLQREGVDKGKITRWMLPDWILISDTIPKTSVGKFDKKEIRVQLPELLEEGEAGAAADVDRRRFVGGQPAGPRPAAADR